MKYYVCQFGDVLFQIVKIQGYKDFLFLGGTEITADEYRKLYYSSDKRTVTKGAKTDRGSREYVTMNGNASEILGREVRIIHKDNHC